ncbi:hypothetical protein [Actinokineospora globicatena]|uniref:Uncharacterized protein n=1 Tax=Actinokineospora globicatena TaxID=103729 RepID=A0A9W6VA51_9PSEU|nr:hypothetical protein [Actinokineospora globicatena]GLW91638.1 hypothetical protein Aglo03_24540 [Actinokineospora globicatena]
MLFDTAGRLRLRRDEHAKGAVRRGSGSCDAAHGKGVGESDDWSRTLVDDADDLRVVVEKAPEGCSSRTKALLSAPGFDAGQWVANGCVTGSGKGIIVKIDASGNPCD